MVTMEDIKLAHVPRRSIGSDKLSCLSAGWLRELRSHGVVTSPATGLKVGANGKTKRLRHGDRLCFPWAVVELKRDADERHLEEQCYCQAANAAAAALALQQPFMRELAVVTDDDYMFPIIAFTCVGPEIKTWIAYPRKNDDTSFIVSAGEPISCPS
jgi:hypothetical protein